MLRFLLCLAVWISSVILTKGEGSAELSLEEVKKLRVKDLRKGLAARGQACSGCVEKDEFVAKFMEVQSMPIIESKKEAAPAPESKLDREKLEELMSSLKGSGMNFKAFTPQDLEGMTPDEMAKKFGGGGGGGGGGSGGGKRNSKRSASSSKAKANEDEDRVEL